MIWSDDGGGKEKVFMWQVIPETRCSDGYGSFGEREMTGDRGSRKGETVVDDRVERVVIMSRNMLAKSLKTDATNAA